MLFRIGIWAKGDTGYIGLLIAGVDMMGVCTVGTVSSVGNCSWGIDKWVDGSDRSDSKRLVVVNLGLECEVEVDRLSDSGVVRIASSELDNSDSCSDATEGLEGCGTLLVVVQRCELVIGI